MVRMTGFDCLLVFALCVGLACSSSIASHDTNDEQRANTDLRELVESPQRPRAHLLRFRRNAMFAPNGLVGGVNGSNGGGSVSSNSDQWGEFYKPGHCRTNVKILNVCFKCGRETDSMKFYTRCCNRVGEYLEFCADLLQLPVDR